MARLDSDVIIIGAGAAGLACADELCQFGGHPLILEARHRVGGRILSRRLGGEAIELGADFVHGSSTLARQYIDQFGIPFYEVGDAHLFLNEGRLEARPEFWREIERMSAYVPPSPRHDISVERFLADHGGETTALYRAYVEGFHAADPRKMSARALYRAENEGSEEETGDSRLIGGYDQLPLQLAERIKRNGGRIELGCRVRTVNWQGEGVQLLVERAGKLLEITGRKLVVTLPLGVLQAEPPIGIHWRPKLPERTRRGIDYLAMGAVERLVLRFRTRFWESLSSDPVVFLHAGPEFYFPTWWSLYPLRTNQLVAWQGGPKARELAGWSEEEKISTALTTLARLTHHSFRTLEKELVGCYSHDWTHDELSLGAYSYVKVGGDVAGTYLRLPVDDKIFFAGEATVDGPDRGTVQGALLSGKRAARRVRMAREERPAA